MKTFALRALLFCLLLTPVVAKEPYVPDYFPCPKGAEWNYKVTTSTNMSMDMRRVVTEVSKIASGGWNVVINSFSPTETVNTYSKVAGWVYCDKAVTPSINYTFDYEKDINDLMNPLVVGKTWSYKGQGGGMALEQQWTCTGAETVKVPAGEFKTLKVTANSDMGGNKSKYTFWYVDRVGMVKAVTEAGGVTSTTELVKYTFPK